MKPVLFVTGHVPAYRAGALAALHEREQIEVALFGGEARHGGPAPEQQLPFPHRQAGPAQLLALARSGRYRAVVCPTGGRAALLAAWAGTRAGRVPLVLWASLWAHPRSAAHTLSYLPLRRLYRSADAVVTYGPHVSRYVVSRGARNVHVAPQSVDNAFWRSDEVGAPRIAGWPGEAATVFLYAGRAAPEKGLGVLLAAWESAGLAGDAAALVLAGVGRDFGSSTRSPAGSERAGRAPLALDPLSPLQLRDVYAAADVLVLPSLATATFREPWGLVVNEAMNRGLAVVSSDEVGAAAGGLVREGETGLVVPAGDAPALAEAIRALADDPLLRRRLGEAGRAEVVRYSHEAWAAGFAAAFASVGVSRYRW